MHEREAIIIDIVVTIPKDKYDDDLMETIFYLENDDSYAFWTMNKIPKNVSIGDRIYFVKDNHIESSMKIFDIEYNATNKCIVTNKIWTGKIAFCLDDLKFVEEYIECKGFQGFRYKWWHEPFGKGETNEKK